MWACDGDWRSSYATAASLPADWMLYECCSVRKAGRLITQTSVYGGRAELQEGWCNDAGAEKKPRVHTCSSSAADVSFGSALTLRGREHGGARSPQHHVGLQIFSDSTFFGATSLLIDF